jgi:hypothetical protein
MVHPLYSKHSACLVTCVDDGVDKDTKIRDVFEDEWDDIYLEVNRVSRRIVTDMKMIEESQQCIRSEMSHQFHRSHAAVRLIKSGL